jgi:hypothetical protein
MAAIVGGIPGNEAWFPTGHKTIDIIESAQARKTGVHNPKFIIVSICHFMDKDIACDVRTAGHVARINLADWFAFSRDCGHVAVVVNMPRCANRENLMIGG